jgi:hypothetical protein
VACRRGHQQRWDGDATWELARSSTTTCLKLVGGERIGAHSCLHFLGVAAGRAVRHRAAGGPGAERAVA